MTLRKIELKKCLDEYMDDIVEYLQDDSEFDDVEDLEAYIEKHIHQVDGCVFPELEIDLPSPLDLADK